MTRISRLVSVPTLSIFAALAAGCGGGGEAGGAAPAEGTEVAAAPIENPGTITGTVMFTGMAPENETIDMRAEPACAEKHEGTPVQERVVVGDGTLGNVFVYVKEGLNQAFPAAAAQVELDQNGCVYEPRVLGAQAGQNITIRNSDPVLHNINARPTANRGFNISQPQEGMTSDRSFSTSEVMIPVQCDVHSWMTAFIGVTDHPYFAVTDADGSFTLENLPPGDYVVEAWHEVYGAQEMNVTVPPSGNAEATFTYDAAMAATAVVPLGAPIDLHEHHATHTPVTPAG
jgi:plastocyanin